MNPVKFFGLSVAIVLGLLSIFLFQKNDKVFHFKSQSTSLSCDSSEQATFDLFELSKILYKKGLIEPQASAISIEATMQDGSSKTLVYHTKSNAWQYEDGLIAGMADTIALKALVVPQSNLYKRWQAVLVGPRTVFVSTRDTLLQRLRRQPPGYRYRVSSDVRLAENQSKLLKSGKSAAALSLHQFGLASDIAISKGAKYLTGYTAYKAFGLEAERDKLTWGGRFVGFVDPNHIQLYRNSAELLANVPALSFEYEPFKNYYTQRVEKFVKAGKAKTVEDSAELLQILDAIDEGKLCDCAQKSFKASAVSNADSSTIKLYYSEKNKLLRYLYHDQIHEIKLGKWK